MDSPADTREPTADRRSKRRRLQLSCNECRRKKVSCNRTQPCRRCVSAGKADQCTFDTDTGEPPASTTLSGKEGSQDKRQIQLLASEIEDLRAEVSQLRDLVSQMPPQPKIESTRAEKVTVIDDDGVSENAEPPTDLSHPKSRAPAGYYRQHSLLQFFLEIPQMYPFVKETVVEGLYPHGISLKRTRRGKKSAALQGINDLVTLLPPREDTDILVSYYLNHHENLHRIVHIPTFDREYTKFWVPGQSRYPAMIVLILSMISISASVFPYVSGASVPLSASYQGMCEHWLAACDEWLRKQGMKHRKLVHYQAYALSYMAKRYNKIRKKQFWNETGTMLQNAIMDGLHRELNRPHDTPYMREMRRRVWCTIRELDLQSSLEYCFPTLLTVTDSDALSPSNLDDSQFDEQSKELPSPKPLQEFTSMSYQCLSSRSWDLRLNISRRLFCGRTFASPPTKEEVSQWTSQIYEAINSLPAWDSLAGGPPKRILAYVFLHSQLTECILALHRPHLDQESSHNMDSKEICYRAAHQMLLLNRKLGMLGLHSQCWVREDNTLASLYLTRLFLMPPIGSTNFMATIDMRNVTELMEQCIPLAEDRYLASSDPWSFATLFTALMMLKIHRGVETKTSARERFAKRFLEIHSKHQEATQSTFRPQWPSGTSSSSERIQSPADLQQKASEAASIPPTAAWLDSGYADIGMDFFDINMGISSDWADYSGFEWPALQNAS